MDVVDSWSLFVVHLFYKYGKWDLKVEVAVDRWLLLGEVVSSSSSSTICLVFLFSTFGLSMPVLNVVSNCNVKVIAS